MLQTIIDFISSQLANNQFLSGGAVLAAGGILLAYLRSVPSWIYNWLKRQIMTEIDVPDRDESFKWLCVWLSQHPYRKRCRRWTIQTRRNRNSEYENDRHDYKKPQIILSPAPGVHFLWYKNRLMILQRDRKDGGQDKNVASVLGYRETFNIRLFSRNTQLIIDLIEEARRTANPVGEERIRILCPGYNNWYEATRRMIRPLDSVILDGNLSNLLLTDVKQFLDSEKWYNKHGIPYRRGYLLHGPPGNGKSSIVTAIASHLKLDICVLNLNAFGLSDEKLMELMTSVPLNSIILIEDIDCVFCDRKRVDENENITFSGLLNAIDGVISSEGRILFMTTNHKETLDPALIRPGRIDLDLFIGNASKDQARRLFLQFFPQAETLADNFAQKVASRNLSMAQLQGHLLKFRDNPVDASTQPVQELVNQEIPC